MPERTPLADLPAHQYLTNSAKKLREASIMQLMQDNPKRAAQFVVKAAGLRLDFSKQLLDEAAWQALVQLAQEASVSDGIAALMCGERVNSSEGRAALHTLLRAKTPGKLTREFEAVVAVRARMRQIAEEVRAGRHHGFTGAAITDVVNIGIGGSDLGPRLVTQALADPAPTLRSHYVANIDPCDIASTLAQLDPATTLFIVCSKSFRTEETLANANAARDWLLQAGVASDQLAPHFFAVTTNLEAAAQFGIPSDHCLPLWDWVGGRYSVWSAIGLSCAIALGWDQFEAFLDGARAMDEHFQKAPLANNMPVVLSLLEIWCCNYLGAQNYAVLPYAHQLCKLPDFLQQLTMESNGKGVLSNGEAAPHVTAPILWGSAGTIGQHSFHQLLHQGQLLSPVDFILPFSGNTKHSASNNALSSAAIREQQRQLVANCLAQSRTLMIGRSREEAETSLRARGMDKEQAKEIAPHLTMPGNRPNNMITMEKLTPATLGALLALYEHRTFCSGYLWGINSFDQWGVELGKVIGTQILARLAPQGSKTANDSNDSAKSDIMDGSTEALIQLWSGNETS